MRPRVATILTAQPWEERLTELARTSGGVRLVCRAYDPDELPRQVDVIIGGSETAWMTPACIKEWKSRGIQVVGVHPPGDGPGRRLFEAGGADVVVSSLETPEVLLSLLRSVATFSTGITGGPKVTVVSGARGAPGRTETALGIACLVGQSTSTLIVDLDHESPSLALRLGLPPTPNVDDAIEAIRETGVVPDRAVQHFGDIEVLAGSFRQTMDDARVRREVLWAAKDRADHIVVDAGSPADNELLLDIATETVLVCDASPVGLVRAATLARWWSSEPPSIILNRIGNDPDDIVRAARYSLGLDPRALIPYQKSIRRAAVRAEPPPARFLEQLAPLIS